MSENKLKIGITQGDTNGVGWEVILKTFADPRMIEICTPIIYGSQKVAAFYRKTLTETENVSFSPIASATEARRGKVNVIPAGDENVTIEPGVATAVAGKAAADALRAATADLKAGVIDALVTAPIDKESVHNESFPFTGHTEFLAAELGGEPLMMMCSEILRVGLVTIHIPVAEVSHEITKEKIVTRLQQLRAALKQDFGIVEPRIAVLALNPHAGDGGLLGKEETETIKPAIVEAFGKGVLAYGPFAADGLFASGGYAKYDAVLAMYHDQGLTPFKTLSPEGVNFTACLDKIRTSPDHGVAYDIAGKDKADPQSLRNAIYMAVDIIGHRRHWKEWTRNPLQHFEHERNGKDVSVRDLPDTEKEN
ncbi:MAG: 4-hydroxythreonine-4-phosphate dehydrogenase PdxA [Alistipes sp.]